jgi:hypothetical protein
MSAILRWFAARTTLRATALGPTPHSTFFCKIYGIYTHHQRRSNPNEYGVNMGGIEGVNPAEFKPIVWHDGVNHPSDQKA